MLGLTKLASPAALAIALVAIGAGAAKAEETTCVLMTSTGIVTMPDPVTTASDTFAPIVTYNATNSAATCMHVQFTAQFRSKSPKSVQLRATAGGVPIGFPNIATVSTSASAFDDRTVTFFLPLVGTHNNEIGIEIRSTDGTTVNVKNGILQAQHGS